MPDPSAVVTTEADLESVVGAPPGPIMLKSIRYLDEHCQQFLACSPCAVLGTTTAAGELQARVVGGPPGFAAPRSDTLLELGGVSAGDVQDGAPAGLLALVPGYGETLRVNGRLRAGGEVAALEVEEAFLHCAKAIMRSELWNPTAPSPEEQDVSPLEAGEAAPPALDRFLADAPFVVLVSTDAQGHADVSPRGDPPGLVRRLDDTTIAIAERPGNRRTDTMHNLMDDPRVALLAMVPGRHHVAELRGTARVSTDRALLESMRLRDRTPKAAIVIDIATSELRSEPALSSAGVWDPGRHVESGTLPRAAAIWADHVRRNTDDGAGAKVARRLANKTAIAAGVAYDYRTNL